MQIGDTWQDEMGNTYEVFNIDENGTAHSMLVTLSE